MFVCFFECVVLTRGALTGQPAERGCPPPWVSPGRTAALPQWTPLKDTEIFVQCSLKWWAPNLNMIQPTFTDGRTDDKGRKKRNNLYSHNPWTPSNIWVLRYPFKARRGCATLETRQALSKNTWQVIGWTICLSLSITRYLFLLSSHLNQVHCCQPSSPLVGCDWSNPPWFCQKW